MVGLTAFVSNAPLILWLGLGAVLGSLLVWFARTRGRGGERRVLANGLVVAALIYVAFVLTDGPTWILLEAAGVAVFAPFAAAALLGSSLWLAAGWTLHVVWDVFVHLLTGSVVVPRWYPSTCISFDLLVAGYVLCRFGAPQARTSDSGALESTKVPPPNAIGR